MLMRKDMAWLRNVAEAATVRRNRKRVCNMTDSIFNVGVLQDILLLTRLIGKKVVRSLKIRLAQRNTLNVVT